MEVEDLQMVKKELTFMGFGSRMRLATVTLYTSRLANSQVVKNCKKKKKKVTRVIPSYAESMLGRTLVQNQVIVRFFLLFHGATFEKKKKKVNHTKGLVRSTY